MEYRLTSTSIPKSALKQIYEQVISHEKSVVGDQRNNNVWLDAREQLEINEPSATENSKTLTNELETLSFRTRDNQMLSYSSSVMPDSAEPVPAVTASTVITMTNSSVDNASSSTTYAHMSNELIQNTLGMVSTLQSTISSLQSTVNTLLLKQPAAGHEKPNQLEHFYRDKTIQLLTSSAPAVCNGVAADELPHRLSQEKHIKW